MVSGIDSLRTWNFINIMLCTWLAISDTTHNTERAVTAVHQETLSHLVLLHTNIAWLVGFYIYIYIYIYKTFAQEIYA